MMMMMMNTSSALMSMPKSMPMPMPKSKSKPKPKVAICIPTYEDAEELKITLESFRRQTYQNYKIYVADYDPDRCNATKKVAYKYRDNCTVLDIPRKGIGYARHIAALYSSEPLILAWDADAQFKEDYGLEAMVNTLLRGADITHVYQEFRHDISEFDARRMIYQAINISRYITPLTFTPGILVTREAYNDIGGFRDTEKWEDVLFGVEALQRKKKIVFTPGVTIIVSARRVKNLNLYVDLLHGRLDLDLSIFNYNNAYREDKKLKVE